LKTTLTVRSCNQYISTGTDGMYELSITGTGTQYECELMKELYNRGFDLAVKEMNREMAVTKLTKQK
jgi:hypothetical protein